MRARALGLGIALLWAGCGRLADVGASAELVVQVRGASSGTGFYVLSGERASVILTAAHVVESDPTIVDGREVMLVLRHPELDVAAIVVRGSSHVLQPDPRPARVGERVSVIGYAMGDTLSLTEGLAGEPGSCSAPVIFGCSGAPVLDARGRVLGVVTQVGMCYGQAVPHVCKYVATDALGAWLDNVRAVLEVVN